MTDVRFAVVDIETTGLDAYDDSILEVGCMLLDRELNLVAEWHSLVNGAEQYQAIEKLIDDAEHNIDRKFVRDMHVKSGLIDELQANGNMKGVMDVEEEFADFLHSHGLRHEDSGEPAPIVTMTGSSIHFDAGFLQRDMPMVLGYFHYRRLDISSFKVAVDTWSPVLQTKRHEQLNPAKSHRVLSDCWDSIEELKFYLDVLGFQLT